jgi:ABC-2 type transport system ATP-binding protein
MNEATLAAIALCDVRKAYRGNMVLDGLDLTVHGGEVAGLIGPNGSGKTTVLRIIAGLVQPDSGEVVVQGRNLSSQLGAVPPHLGILFDPPGVQPHLTGLENLCLLASIRRVIGKAEAALWMRKVGLDPDSRQRVATYSQGMRQRLGLAQALMEAPAILLLDEPTNGLDPDFVEIFVDLLMAERNRGVAIVMAGHHLDEMGRLCNSAWKLVRGKLLPVDPADMISGWRNPVETVD